MRFDKWLDTFVDEKGLDPEYVFTIEADDCFGFHIIPLGMVVEVMKQMDPADQAKVKGTFVKIDFLNGDVLNYMEFLAKMIVEVA